MLIGVFSDVHDNLANLKAAFELLRGKGIQKAIFCGDFCSPIVAKIMGSFGGEIHCVFGNGDGDRFTISRLATSECRNVVLHGESAEIELDGKRIAVNHYPLLGRALAHTGDYSAVFSGHTHVAHHEYIKNCLWLNPGEIMGWKGAPSLALYETSNNTANIVTVG